jgi:uncharacterized protein (TIGR03437 family)
MSVSLCRSICLGFPLLFGGWPGLAQTNIASANYGDTRSNANVNESILTRATVSSASFGKVGGFPVDGQIYAQPLYISGLPMPGVGTKNVVFAATLNDSVYAIDADAPGSTTPLWQVNLGTAAASSSLPDVNDVNPQLGILSTPVIDVNAQIIYAVAETFEAGAPVFRLHALSLLDGHEMPNAPVVIGGTVPGTGGGSVDGVIAFDPVWHLQRPGLALANGNVYVAFGSHGDAGNYHGWVMAYNAANVQQQTAIFNTTPQGNAGGIWQSGRAPTIDSAGNIYIVTGNGDFDGVTNFSGAILKLSGSDLSLLDWYTPASWQYLNANDLDVGSTGALLAPGTNLVLAGDKGGHLINLDSTSLGHVENASGADEFSVSPASIFTLAIWQSSAGMLLYEHDLNGFLKSYAVTSAAITQTPVSTGTWNGDSLYHGMAISSNGPADGIVWETTGNHSQPGIPGTLHAWNASDLTQELWNSDMNSADVLGSFAKLVAPLVANGRVYVPTLSNQLVIYGLQSAGNTNLLAPQVASILNGGSLVQNSVSPGEVVSIFGTNLGPSVGATFQADDSGLIPPALAGTQVSFDGTAAPLMYVSANQINAVVPFEVAGPVTQIVVTNGGGSSTPAAIPVVAAAPGLFTSSGLGNGQAAVLNQDGTVNSATNPADVESVVTLFATGLGQTNPAGVDGAIAVGPALPVPLLPVSVTIGGLPAYVVSAAAAPQTIEGVFQIAVRVPPLAPTGSIVLAVLQVGDAVSQVDVWLALQ